MSRIRRENQRLFFDGGEVHGVQSATLEWDNQLNLLRHVGMYNRPRAILPFGPGRSSFSASTYICEVNSISAFGTLYNGVVVQNVSDTSNNYGFVSGMLSSYTTRCSVGTIPQSDYEFEIFGQAGLISTADSPHIASQFALINAASNNFSPIITGPGTLSINLNDFTTNRLQSIQITQTAKNTPQYIVGQRMPIRIDTDGTQQFNVSLTFEPDTYIPKKLWDFPCDSSYQSIIMNIYHYINPTSSMYLFSSSFMRLNSESYNISVDSNLQTVLNFKGWNYN